MPVLRWMTFSLMRARWERSSADAVACVPGDLVAPYDDVVAGIEAHPDSVKSPHGQTADCDERGAHGDAVLSREPTPVEKRLSHARPYEADPILAWGNCDALVERASPYEDRVAGCGLIDRLLDRLAG